MLILILTQICSFSVPLSLASCSGVYSSLLTSLLCRRAATAAGCWHKRSNISSAAPTLGSRELTRPHLPYFNHSRVRTRCIGLPNDRSVKLVLPACLSAVLNESMNQSNATHVHLCIYLSTYRSVCLSLCLIGFVLWNFHHENFELIKPELLTLASYAHCCIS